ncbi:hypothetical protein NC653_011184 [Populus alba x Populus x berolinensis]|uniref:Sm domain-containing protein n=1 Tax=Populus alba x Populus x berolinensis TaxID=444605 RepID=A0AAD6R1V6_9ROSI|nr:hypothetical protein NC653_011184 [Populus alba x Populus x berolinensis]
MAAATAEAARSSSSSSTGSGGGGGSSADSYVGSLISLTSKSEIRYEGVLFNINTQESTIGLRNVRSFGTEGRKKDGLQVPPSDKIYEFILFRGTDIKDLQVKSSPPVQTATPVHNDPAIIQVKKMTLVSCIPQYPQAATASMNLPSSGNGSLTDPSSHASSSGLPRPTFQGSLPQYQPDASLESWGPSHLLPTTNGSGLAMPMYWQGYYGPSNGVQAPQQALLSTHTWLVNATFHDAICAIAQKDVQVVQVSSPELSAPPPTTAAAEVQKPILPLPSQPEHKVYGAPMYTYHTGRGGRGRGRENETHKAQDRDDLLDEDDVGSSKLETKTSVNFSHHWGSRGGWGPGRGGRSGGGYYGRGYGYAGRGRGYGKSHGSF